MHDLGEGEDTCKMLQDKNVKMSYLSKRSDAQGLAESIVGQEKLCILIDSLRWVSARCILPMSGCHA